MQQRALYETLRDGVMASSTPPVWTSGITIQPKKSARSHTPPADFPFHELDNVVLSPHRGGMTGETEQLRMAHMAALLNAAARGKLIPNRVDLQRGY